MIPSGLESMVRRRELGGSDLTQATVNRNSPAGGSNPSSAPNYFAMNCHACDVLDEGPASFAQLARDVGLTSISVAASYHGGRALLPQNAKHHVYFIEQGVGYFQPSHRFFRTAEDEASSQTASR